MRTIGAAAIALIVCGVAGAQYYPQPYYPPMHGQPMYMQPAGQPLQPRMPPAQPPLPPAANAYIPQLLPYPSLASAPGGYTARALASDSSPQAPIVKTEPAEDAPPASSPAEKKESSPETDLPPQSPPESAPETLPEAPPETPPAPDADPGPPPDLDKSDDTERIVPTPAPRQQNPYQGYPQHPVFPQPMVAAPAPAPVAVVAQPSPAKLLGHYFHLEQLHSLVNYSVPVHYPKEQARGPWCYGDAYFSFLWSKSQNAGFLIASASGQPLVGPGRLQFDNGERLGWRFTLGSWLNKSQTIGLEASYMSFAEREPSFSAVDVIQVEPVIVPLNSTKITSLSRFSTGDINCRRELARGLFGHIDCLAGIRYLSLVEELNFDNVAQLDGVNRIDNFRTENTVIAAQVGVAGELLCKYCSLNFWAKPGFGNVHRRLVLSDINDGGVEPLGEGTFSRNRPVAVFEAGAFLGVQVCNCVRLSAGYTFIYVADVIRPADQIDSDVGTFVRGDSNYWLQGISGGFEFRF